MSQRVSPVVYRQSETLFSYEKPPISAIRGASLVYPLKILKHEMGLAIVGLPLPSTTLPCPKANAALCFALDSTQRRSTLPSSERFQPGKRSVKCAINCTSGIDEVLNPIRD